MHRDKKVEDGRIRFVLPTGIGKDPILQYIKEKTVKKALAEVS
jgi:3-dehydroquinate synthetase